MRKLTELHLDSGYIVRCRPVPPLMANAALDKLEFWYPPPPTIDVKVQKGRSTETVDAPDDSPEMEEWLKKVREVEQAQSKFIRQFNFSTGIVDWKDADDEKARFLKHPPKGWNPDATMKEVFGDDTPRRTVFIMCELIVTQSDFNKVHDAIMPGEGALVKPEEVQAAKDTFQDQV